MLLQIPRFSPASAERVGEEYGTMAKHFEELTSLPLERRESMLQEIRVNKRRLGPRASAEAAQVLLRL